MTGLVITPTAERAIRTLARVIGWERREIVQALESHASIERAEHRPSQPVVRRVIASASTARPVPKFEYVRSKTLMHAYRLIPCQHCGANDGTVCGAHSNWAVHGKGRGIKASDIYAASLCNNDHTQLDQGSRLTEDERKAIWWGAHTKTVAELLRLGLWPDGVPIPDITRSPF